MSSATSATIALRWTASPRRAVLTFLAISAFAFGAALALNGTANLGWHAATRITAVIAYPLWLMSFVASPLASLRPSPLTRLLRARRRALGLAFAVALTIHGIAILGLARLEPETAGFDLSTIGGGLGFVMMFAMAATSNDAAVKKIGGRAWRRLHDFGQLALAVVYLVTYAELIVEDLSYWPAFAALIFAFGLRGAVAIQSRSLRSTRLPTE